MTVLQAKAGADVAPKKALDAYMVSAGQAGDAKTATAANKAAVEAVAIAQQAVVGQFWTDPKFQEAFQQALRTA